MATVRDGSNKVAFSIQFRLSARGYAPASGGFWLPATEDYLMPVHKLHTHGFADKIVPLEGRAIHSEQYDVTITQADIWQDLDLSRFVPPQVLV